MEVKEVKEKLEALEKVKKEIDHERKLSIAIIAILIFISISGIILDLATHDFKLSGMWLIVFVNALTLKVCQERVLLWKKRATESQIQILDFMQEVKVISEILAEKEGINIK